MAGNVMNFVKNIYNSLLARPNFAVLPTIVGLVGQLQILILKSPKLITDRSINRRKTSQFKKFRESYGLNRYLAVSTS